MISPATTPVGLEMDNDDEDEVVLVVGLPRWAIWAFSSKVEKIINRNCRNINRPILRFINVYGVCFIPGIVKLSDTR